MEIGKRLRKIQEFKFKTVQDFAKYLEMKPPSLQTYLKEESKPGFDILRKIEKLGININWLLTGEGEMDSSFRWNDTVAEARTRYSNKSKLIPIIGEVACGQPATVYYEAGNKYLEVGDAAGLKTPFILIAKGDSMKPYINSGDKLLCVDEPDKIKNGRAVVVSFRTMPETYEANAKLIRFMKDDRIMLYSINTVNPPEVYNKKEIYYIYKVVRIIREVK